MTGSPPSGDALLVVRDDQQVVDVGGAQAVDFLHRMLSQDVKGIPAGGMRLACLLTPLGKVVADFGVWNRGPGRTLVLSRAAADRGLPALERYVIADDVTFAEASPALVPALLVGPRAEAVAAAASGALRALDVAAAPGPFGAAVARHLLVPTAHLAAAVAALEAAGAVVAAGDAFDRARVEAGAPWFGAELDERVLPNEAGLSATAVAWSKGCYVGQEPVVMAAHRGHPPTLLCRLALAGETPPPRDTPLRQGATAAGRVTTAVRVPGRPGVVALGFVRHGLAVAGTALSLEDGTAVTVATVLA